MSLLSKIYSTLLIAIILCASVQIKPHFHVSPYRLFQGSHPAQITERTDQHQLPGHDEHNCIYCALHVRIAVEESQVFLAVPFFRSSRYEPLFFLRLSEDPPVKIYNRGPPDLI